MSLNLIEKWFSELPEYERNMPIIKLDNVSYTPQQILHEVRRRSDVGNKLQAKVERMRIGHSLEVERETLAEERLLKLLEERPVIISALVSPEYAKEEFTSKDLAESLKKRDEVGKSLVKAEMGHMDAMLKLGR